MKQKNRRGQPHFTDDDKKRLILEEIDVVKYDEYTEYYKLIYMPKNL
jgi:hypothetical protein